MQKKRLFSIMSKTKAGLLKGMVRSISDKYKITVIKEPAKTLTMIKMREPVKSGLFYIGEVMVTEAVVEISGTRGIAVTMGDDFEKVLYMAIIDCGFNLALDEMDLIEEQLISLEEKQLKMREKENAMHLKTMVSFNSMDGGGDI